MKQLLTLEEIAMFVLGIFLFNQLSYEWWWFLMLILTPDFGMIGYAFGNKIGAITYNITHHKAVAIALYLLGYYIDYPFLQLLGTVFFAHSALDRIFGYGLKYFSGFHQTHLGTIGKNK